MPEPQGQGSAGLSTQDLGSRTGRIPFQRSSFLWKGDTLPRNLRASCV